jgi:hypothetical protein
MVLMHRQDSSRENRMPHGYTGDGSQPELFIGRGFRKGIPVSLLKNTLFALLQVQGERKIYCEQRGHPFVVSLPNHK